MADMDVDALQQQLEALKEQQQKAQQKLNEMKILRGRGPPNAAGDRSFGAPQRLSGVFNRLGPGAGPQGGPSQQRDGPAGRGSVFDRLYSNRGQSGDLDRNPPDRNGLFSRSSREVPLLHRQTSRDDVDRGAGSNTSRPPIHSRLSSRVVAPDGSAAGGSSAPRDLHQHDRQKEQHHDTEHAGEGLQHQQATAAAITGRKRILSAVMINGEARTVSSAADKEDLPPEPPPKRPTLQTDARSKRRAQLMLGRMLVGTLQKAKDESDAFRSTAARRQELEKRAADKAAAEAERLKEQERAARQQERHNQVCQLLDIEQQAKAKELEIRYAKIIQRRQKLLNFCVSKTQPPIYWLPREPSDELAAQSQDHAAIFEGWKQQQMQQLETEKAALAALIATRKDKSALRLAGGGQHQDEDHEEEQEDGEHQDGAEAATAETVEALEAGVDDPGVLVETAIIDEEDQTGAEQPADEQYEDQQQQQQGADFVQAAEQEAPAAAQQRSRRRQRGSDDEEEERLLSSEEEEDL